ncbi:MULTISPECIES: ANTAR domain-containing protein [Brucella]|uniref:DNA-binding heavy metal response regulator n=2 Tax=Ochrobactrum soli TaxID=2448455 RepID=A0A2P9HDD3_9HYPH|nr:MULTISPECIES: ANTAR domain-containing protein [Brucella]MDX4074249.1 ANTAR domain-containing protein [Brucella sp. NBRC 113783]SPL62112.1 DNA-binding heavy metal response regulator [[Ochrobactrum] soli]
MTMTDPAFTVASWGAFENWTALIVHRRHTNVDAIVQQLRRIGVDAVECWPDLPEHADISRFNVVFFDVDMGHDEQFPWPPQQAPVPTVALIGSEAPGRIGWALNQGADAQLLKPIGNAGVYSALVIAMHNFQRRHALATEIGELRESLAGREAIAQATAILMFADNISARQAYQKLRLAAMAERVSVEAFARRFLNEKQTGNDRERA